MQCVVITVNYRTQLQEDKNVYFCYTLFSLYAKVDIK